MRVQQNGLKNAPEYSNVPHEDCVFSQQKLGFHNEGANACTCHMGRIKRKMRKIVSKVSESKI